MRIAIALVLALSLVGAGIYLMSGSDDPVAGVPAGESDSAIETATADDELTSSTDVPETADETTETAEPESTAPTQNGTGVIVGSVQRFDGSTVAGAEVRCELINWSVFQTLPDEPLIIDVTADETGNFEVDRLPDGGYALSATDGTLKGTTSTVINATSQRVTVGIQILHSNSVRGIVKDAAGQPVANAVVLPWRGPNVPGYPQVVRGVSGDDGRFSIDGLAAAEHRLVARAREHAPTMSDWVFTNDEEEVILILEAGVTVSGKVRQQDTTDGIASVQVALRSVVPYLRESAGTDADGQFQIQHVADHQYAMVVEHATLVLTSDIDVRVVGQDVAGLDLEVGSGAIVTGHVQDAEENGIEGVEVRAGFWDPVRGSSRNARTDKDGYYRMEGLVRGVWNVHRTSVEGYPNPSWNESKRVQARVGATIDGVDFRLIPGLVVYGRTVDGTGTAVAGANVSGWNDSGARQQAKSDAEGRFQLSGFEFGDNLRLEASAERLVMVPSSQVLEEDKHEELELVLEPESRLGGVVVDLAGEPVPNINVNVQRTEGFTNQTKTTDAKGRFNLGGLSSGEYAVRAQRPNVRRWGQAEPASMVKVEAGEIIRDHRILYDAQGVTISGRVMDSLGQPVVQANIWSYRTDAGRGGGMGASAVTDEEGYYIIEGLLDGTYQVQVSHKNHAGSSKDNVTAGDENVDFTIAGRGTVAGHVVDAGGNAVTRFEVFHMKGRHTKLRSWGTNFTVVSDEEGRFTIDDIEQGVNTVVIRAEEYVDTFQVIEGVEAGKASEDIEIQLEAGRVIEGVVVDDNNEPVRGAKIYVGNVPRAWERQNRSVATTDAKGEFKFSNISSGTAQLSAHHPEFASASVAVHETSGEVEFVLTRGGVIKGRVQVDGRAPGGAWVSVASVSDEGMNVSADGTFRFAGRPAGNVIVTVHVWEEPRRQMSRTAVVEDGRDTVVDFTFLPGDSSLEGDLIGEGLNFNRARVSLRFEGEVEGAGETFHARADQSGHFVFASVPAGNAHLLVEMGGMGSSFRQQGIDVVIPAGGSVTQDIEFGGGSVITGTLTGNDGAAMTFSAAVRGDHQVDSIDLMTFQALQSKVAAVVSPDEEGNFQLEGLEPGTYTIICIVFDEEPSGIGDFSKARVTSKLIELKKDDRLEVNLRVPPK